jgi:uroporphyrinogen decarboxylase
MTKKERVRAALRGGTVDQIPISLWRHDYLGEWTSEGLLASTLEQYGRYDWDFIKFNPRATYFAEAWGNRYERATEAKPANLITPAVNRPEQLAGVKPLDVREGVLGEHLGALRLLTKEVAAEVDVIHTVFSPLAVAAQLSGSDGQFLSLATADAAAAHAALAAVAETLRAYAAAALDAGASGIFYAPLGWASRDTCPEAFYLQFGRPYDLEVLAAVQRAPFNVLHVCRNRNMIDLLLDYPVSAFNWADDGEGNPSLADVRNRTNKAVMGGLDHTRLHEMSTDEVAGQAEAALADGAERVFLTAGCTIRPETPTANIEAAIAVARSAVADRAYRHQGGPPDYE